MIDNYAAVCYTERENNGGIREGAVRMSKYAALWEHVRGSTGQMLKLTFEETENIAGVPIDHSFLRYKKELTEFGWRVGKISMKEKTIIFEKLD